MNCKVEIFDEVKCFGIFSLTRVPSVDELVEINNKIYRVGAVMHRTERTESDAYVGVRPA